MEKVGNIAKSKLHNVNNVNNETLKFPLKRETMNNDNNVNIEKSERAKRTERIAWSLVEHYDAPGSYRYFLKVAWHLSEAEIWDTVELSHRKNISSPVKYFVATTRIIMTNKGVDAKK